MAHIGFIFATLAPSWPILAPSWPHFGTIFTHVDPKKEDKLNNCSKQIHSKIGSPKRRLAHIIFFSKSLWMCVGTKMLAPIPTPAQPKPTQANSNPSQVSPRPLPKNAHVVKFSNLELQKNPISCRALRRLSARMRNYSSDQKTQRSSPRAAWINPVDPGM